VAWGQRSGFPIPLTKDIFTECNWASGWKTGDYMIVLCQKLYIETYDSIYANDPCTPHSAQCPLKVNVLEVRTAPSVSEIR